MNASGRLNTCKSSAPAMESGKRVRNTYAIYPSLGHSPKKFGLIPHKIAARHLVTIKDPSVKDERASH